MELTELLSLLKGWSWELTTLSGQYSPARVELIDKPNFRDIFDPSMTIFAVAKGNVECGGFIVKRAQEQVLHCESLEPGFYAISHAFWGLNVNVGRDDTVSLAVNSIKCIGDNIPGHLRFCGSVSALAALEDGSEELSVIPRFGRTALEIGPDKRGITVSLVRYKSRSESPLTISERIADEFITSIRAPKSRGAGGGVK